MGTCEPRWTEEEERGLEVAPLTTLTVAVGLCYEAPYYFAPEDEEVRALVEPRLAAMFPSHRRVSPATAALRDPSGWAEDMAVRIDIGGLAEGRSRLGWLAPGSALLATTRARVYSREGALLADVSRTVEGSLVGVFPFVPVVVTPWRYGEALPGSILFGLEALARDPVWDELEGR